MVTSWWLNRDYIARVLCVNRDKPQMHCNGKCHLAKQLKAVENTERKQQPGGQSKDAFQAITLFCQDVLPVGLTSPAWDGARLPAYPTLQVLAYAWDRPGPDHPPAEGQRSTHFS